MTGKSRKKRGPAKPRDPFWRHRRAFAEKKKASARAYRRAESRRAERAAQGEASRDNGG